MLNTTGPTTAVAAGTATGATSATTTTAAGEPVLATRSVAFVLTALVAAFMVFLAVRGALGPISAAHGFGIDLASPLDAFYLHVKADRDLAIGAILVALLIYRRPAPLALFVGASTVAPVLDCLLVALEPRGHLGYALAVHGSAAVYGVVTTWLLARARGTAAASRSAS